MRLLRPSHAFKRSLCRPQGSTAARERESACGGAGEEGAVGHRERGHGEDGDAECRRSTPGMVWGWSGTGLALVWGRSDVGCTKH